MTETNTKDYSIYEVLKSKEIIAILDGDTTFGNYEFEDGGTVPIAMPRLSGPDLCGLCNLFGLSKTYSASNPQSRWQYLEELIEHCSKEKKCSQLLSYMFSKDKFSKIFQGRERDEIEKAYENIITSIKNKINGLLLFSDAEIVFNEDIVDVVKLGSLIAIEDSYSKLKKGTTVYTAFNIYELKKQIGQGGNGKVWEAVDKEECSVAIKFLEREKSEKVLKRFKNETFFCIKHAHKNILPILDYGTAGKEFVFYVMPLYQQTLRDRIKMGIEPAEIPKIFSGILEGLHFAHCNDAIHRDIKPENILFAEHSNEPIIADFGIAHFDEDELATFIETSKGERMANFQYAAPEQRKKGGASLPQTDIYSAGLILNEMFTGEIPQALDYRTIGEINPEYRYLDELFEQLFKQDPNERLYPEELIISEMWALSEKQKNEEEILRLRNLSFELEKPEEYNPQVEKVKYENGNLIFELDRRINQDWFQLLVCGSYSHSFVMGYDTSKLKMHGCNMITMLVGLDVSQTTIRSVVENVRKWIVDASEEYRAFVHRQIENELLEKEQNRLREIQLLKKETEMNNFLSTL